MNKKYIIVLSVLGVLFGVSLLVGISYAYYIVNVSQTNKNVIKSSCLNLSISNEENVIKLEKQIPIMNEEGKNLTPYTFTINNTCNSMIGYSLNLEELDGSTLASKYIMTMVNDKTYVNMASLSSTDNYYANSVESRVLATGSLGPNASINYSLRLWMDEETPMTTDAMNKSFRSKVVVVATPTKTVDFDYTGTEQVFTAPVSGTYKLETWGAQGGSAYEYYGGYGGFSLGTITLNKDATIYINVGGRGGSSESFNNIGGYNGGGYSGENLDSKTYSYGGGGATHIATMSGTLSTLENYKNNIIIVSGGGGGTYGFFNTNYSSGGGYIGVAGQTDVPKYKTDGFYTGGGSQNGPGKSFHNERSGQFGTGKVEFAHGFGGGGGGGLYGGSTGYGYSGGGGSGYIGNSLLTNKAMYCYNCEESNEESTKTISTTCAEEIPTSNCAKKGNGYARITYIG